MPQSAFVEREPELHRLGVMLDCARIGTRCIAVVTGEPGIGKTRLAREFVREAGLAGATTTWGRCYQGTSPPPLTPWGETIGDLLTGDHEQAADASILAIVLPHQDTAAPPILCSGWRSAARARHCPSHYMRGGR
jgi:predicted ATPase